MTPPDVRVPDVIRRFARERPDAVALRHGERELTYAELDARSSRLAQALLAAGIGPGSRVAYLGRTAPEVLELLFAAGKAGRGRSSRSTGGSRRASWRRSCRRRDAGC